MSFGATVLFVIVCCFVQGQYVIASSGSEVAETGRSLVIVFDTTWSMDDDLQELRLGAAQIVKEMLKKDTNPIYNYVFVPFNDPCEYIWIMLGIAGTFHQLLHVITQSLSQGYLVIY